MSASIFVDTFNIGTGAAASTVARTGYGFQPKFAIFFWSGRTSSTDAAGAQSHKRGVGVAVSTSSRWAALNQSEHAVDPSNGDCMLRDDACIGALDTAGAVEGRADLQSFDADGLTLVIDVQFVTDLRVTVFAVGGSDVTNIACGTGAAPASITTQDVTSPGFQPDAGFFAGVIATALNTVLADAALSIGVAAGATPGNAVTSATSNNAAGTIQSISYSRAGECLAIPHPSATAINEIAAVSAWLSNGFRLNWTASSAARLYGWLVWNGGSWAVGDVLTQTSTGTFSETGLSFTPKGLLLGSHCKAQSASATADDNDELSIGAASGASNQAAHATLERDQQSVSEVITAVEHDALYANPSAAGVEGIVALTSLNSGGFTLDQVDADPAQAFLWYLAGGDNASSGALLKMLLN